LGEKVETQCERIWFMRGSLVVERAASATPRMIPVAKGEVLIRLWERRQGEENRANSRGGVGATRARPEPRMAVETSGESWTKPSVIAMVPLER